MQVAIVKYNAGNIYSVVNALKRLGIEPTLTDDAELLMKADIPGSACSCGQWVKTRRPPTRPASMSDAINIWRPVSEA